MLLLVTELQYGSTDIPNLPVTRLSEQQQRRVRRIACSQPFPHVLEPIESERNELRSPSGVAAIGQG